MARSRFKPIEIETDDPSTLFSEHRLEISKAIIYAVDFGIRNKKKKVDFAYILIKGILVITLSIDSREYVELLDQNIENLIEFEAYEECALAVKLKNKINKKLQKDELQLHLQKSGSSKTN
ncbi:hypothetical protein UFOVP449_129 [uncultured Caudovirales phage]|uniref:Uncharacterized protein n=1 Tax=uncultured Caudovirales phage TaxID=2100421 RepID=A0A6J5MDN4_9CAUD|nr:hypothetical protein UFOVP449_129 [uncultured Caudovirales phage]